MSRHLSKPTDPVSVRLQFERDQMPLVEYAAEACQLSLSSFCRLAIELLAENNKTNLELVRSEASRRLRACISST